MVARVRRVHGGLACYPMTVAFGKVHLGEKVWQRVDLYDFARAPREIEAISCSDPSRVLVEFHPPGKFSVTKIRDLEGILVGHLVVTISTSAPAEVDARVQIVLKNENRKPDEIVVRGVIASPVEHFPKLLTLPRHASNGPVYTARIVIRTNGCQLLEFAPIDLPRDFTLSGNGDGELGARVLHLTWEPGRGGLERKPGETVHLRFRAKTVSVEHEFEIPILLVSSR